MEAGQTPTSAENARDRGCETVVRISAGDVLMLNDVQDAQEECDARPNGRPGGQPKRNSIPSARFKINVLQ